MPDNTEVCAHLSESSSAVACLTSPALAADRDTRLADAAMNRDPATVRTLLQQKTIDVNAPGRDGTPALHWAVRVNDLETASALLRAGADAQADHPLRRDADVAGRAERQRGDDQAARSKAAPT